MEAKDYKSKSQSGGVQRRFRQSARAEGAEGRRQKAEAGDDRSTKAIVVALQVGRSPGSFFGTDVVGLIRLDDGVLYMKSREETDCRRDEKTIRDIRTYDCVT